MRAKRLSYTFKNKYNRMKKVLNVGIGGRPFTIDEDAYQRLDGYLNAFRIKAQSEMGHQTKEVLDELEMRIAELFDESLSHKMEVVNLALVNKVISQLGMPDGSPADFGNSTTHDFHQPRVVKKLFRDPDSKAIGGVCGGLAAYFDVDIVLMRVLFILALVFGSLGFWFYVILWIVVPLATTAAQKCEMRGLPVTAENLRRFSTQR